MPSVLVLQFFVASEASQFLIRLHGFAERKGLKCFPLRLFEASKGGVLPMSAVGSLWVPLKPVDFSRSAKTVELRALQDLISGLH